MNAAPSGFRRWEGAVLLGSVFVAYALNYADRQAIFSIYPALKAQLGFTDAELGTIGTAFSFVYGICSPIAGQIGDRFPQKTLVVLSLALWSVLTVCTGFCHSVAVLLVCRALIGVSESLFMPAAIALTGSAYPPGARSRAVGLLKSAQIVGVIFGGWFGGALADRGHWRWAFYSLGAAGLVYCLPCHTGLKQFHRPVFAETRRAGATFAAAALARIASYGLLSFVFMVESFGLWFLYAWLPSFFQEKFSLSMAGASLWATVYLQGGTFAGIVTGGWIADRICSWRPAIRFELIAAGLILCAPCFHLVGRAPTLGLTVAAAVGLGLGSGCIMANVFPAAFDVVPVDARASAVGWLNFFSAIGAGLGPLFGGLWKQSLGISQIMTVTGAAYLVTALILIGGTKLWFAPDYSRMRG